MKLRRQIALISLSTLLILMSFLPQAAQARSQDRTVANLEAFATISLVAAASLLPTAGMSGLAVALEQMVSSPSASAPARNNALVSTPDDRTATLSSLVLAQEDDWDLDTLLDEVLTDQATYAHLLLITKKNTWAERPKDHYEMVQCVEHDSLVEAGYFGASLVSGIDQDAHPHSKTSGYTSYYVGYLNAYTDSGTW